MKKVEIDIEIGKDGAVSFHVMGIKGPACLEVMKAVQRRLGKVESWSPTSEYYEQGEQDMEITVKSGE